MAKWSELTWKERFEAMSKRTAAILGFAGGVLTALLVVLVAPKKAAIAILAALAIVAGIGGGASWRDDVADVAKSSDEAGDGLATKGKPAPAPAPVPVKPKGTWLDLPADEQKAATEHGEWAVVQTRPCRDGQSDVTLRPQYQRDFLEVAFPGSTCGVVWSQTEWNFLADEGESDLVNCMYRATNCPSSFTWALLTSAATPTEASTWSSLSANECSAGACAGYENAGKTLTRDATGWTTLDTVASGTGGCTETSCARVSTAQQVITASGNWSSAARYIVIRATTSNRLIAVAQLSADRQLQNLDQLNLTYRQAMQ